MAGAFDSGNYLYVEPQNLTFDSNGLPISPISGSITINSSAIWSISLIPSWMDVFPTSGGAGATVVYIDPQSNEGAKPRFGSFKVTSGSNEVWVYITQSGVVIIE